MRFAEMAIFVQFEMIVPYFFTLQWFSFVTLNKIKICINFPGRHITISPPTPLYLPLQQYGKQFKKENTPAARPRATKA